MNTTERKADVRAVLALVQAASPGPWEVETESNDAGFHSYVMTDANDVRLFDSLNAEACVNTESDDDGVYRWDVTAEHNFKAAVAAVEFIRLHGAALAELIEKGRCVQVTRDAYRAAGSGAHKDRMAAHVQAVDEFCAALARVQGGQ